MPSLDVQLQELPYNASNTQRKLNAVENRGYGHDPTGHMRMIPGRQDTKLGEANFTLAYLALLCFSWTGNATALHETHPFCTSLARLF